MASENSLLVRYEDLRSLGFAAISGTYAGVGTSFVHPVRMLKVSNLTNANLIISFNGIDDKDVVAASSAYIYDFASNQSESAGNLEQQAGERLYVREEDVAPTLGNVYVTVIYADQV